jgi:hypothetical protein
VALLLVGAEVGAGLVTEESAFGVVGFVFVFAFDTFRNQNEADIPFSYILLLIIDLYVCE